MKRTGEDAVITHSCAVQAALANLSDLNLAAALRHAELSEAKKAMKEADDALALANSRRDESLRVLHQLVKEG